MVLNTKIALNYILSLTPSFQAALKLENGILKKIPVVQIKQSGNQRVKGRSLFFYFICDSTLQFWLMKNWPNDPDIWCRVIRFTDPTLTRFSKDFKIRKKPLHLISNPNITIGKNYQLEMHLRQRSFVMRSIRTGWNGQNPRKMKVS